MEIRNCCLIESSCMDGSLIVPVATSIYFDVENEDLFLKRNSFMHPVELSYFDSISNEGRAGEFLMGRFAAKKALGSLTGTSDYRDICIARGIFSQPVVTMDTKNNFDVSITHKKNVALALAHSALYPMGIDIETLEDARCQVLESQLTPKEIRDIKREYINYELTVCQLWVIKEALSKVLKTGLTTPFTVFETCDHSFHSTEELRCFFSNFYQYHARCWCIGKYVIAIVYPRSSYFDLKINQISSLFPNSKGPHPENVS
jgi:4'-phosphopantetheinyl transferase